MNAMQVKERINAIKTRFSDKGVLFTSRLDRLQHGNANAYAYGCVHNIVWSEVKAKARVWNEPMPIPCYNVKLTPSIKNKVESELTIHFTTFTPTKESTRLAAKRLAAKRLGLRLIQGGAK